MSDAVFAGTGSYKWRCDRCPTNFRRLLNIVYFALVIALSSGNVESLKAVYRYITEDSRMRKGYKFYEYHFDRSLRDQNPVSQSVKYLEPVIPVRISI